MASPRFTKAWVLNSQNGPDSLELKEKLPLPALKDDEILVKIYCASLNYRELMIAKVSKRTATKRVVPIKSLTIL